MSRQQRIVRVAFNQNVNLPGRTNLKPDGIEDTIPKRGAIDSSGKVNSPYELFFVDGWVIIQHTLYGTKMRYPFHMVKEATFEEDCVKEAPAAVKTA